MWREGSVLHLFAHIVFIYAVQLCVVIRDVPNMVAMCSLSNSKIRLFSILKKGSLFYLKKLIILFY